MSDLRDKIHKPAISADEQVFLDYHNNSAWAHAKVAAGLVLNPEALEYMRKELEGIAMRQKLYDEQMEKEKAAFNEKSETASVPAGATEQRDAGSDDIHGQGKPEKAAD